MEQRHLRNQYDEQFQFFLQMGLSAFYFCVIQQVHPLLHLRLNNRILIWLFLTDLNGQYEKDQKPLWYTNFFQFIYSPNCL